MSAGGIADQELLAIARKLCATVDIRTRFYRLIPYHNSFLGSDLVHAMIKLELASDENLAISLGNVLMQAGLISHVTNSQHFQNNKFFYRFGDVVSTVVDMESAASPDDPVTSRSVGGSEGDSSTSKSTTSNGFGGLSLRTRNAQHQSHMAEAIHSFLLDFTPTHSKVIKGNDTRYFSGGEVVAYLLDKSILTKEKRAKEVAQKLLATRQILYLDTGIKDTRFDVSALYVLARDVREERNLMKLPYQSEGLTPIFNPYGQDGLELFGIDWITTRIILCMLSGFLLFRLVMADW